MSPVQHTMAHQCEMLIVIVWHILEIQAILTKSRCDNVTHSTHNTVKCVQRQHSTLIHIHKEPRCDYVTCSTHNSRR